MTAARSIFLIAMLMVAFTVHRSGQHAAATGTGILSVVAAEQTVAADQTFTVAIKQNAAVVTMGAQVNLTFNRTLLNVVDVVVGAPYNGGSFTIGVAPQTKEQAIAEANTSTGVLGNIAAFFAPGGGTVPAGTQTFLIVTMRSLPAVSGVSPLTLSMGEMLDSASDELTVTHVSGRVGVGTDADGDGYATAADNCPYDTNASQADGDADFLGDACEGVYGTTVAVADTDGDWCKDGKEVRVYTYAPTVGGDRDPLYFWDFFDVTGDKVVDLNDSLDVLGFFGDPALPGTPGNLRDRSKPDAAKPWRSTEANDTVDMVDVLTVLQQFGHGCTT